MSPSETTSPEQFPLQIDADPGRTLVKDDLLIQIYDHQNRLVHTGSGSRKVSLPKGLCWIA